MKSKCNHELCGAIVSGVGSSKMVGHGLSTCLARFKIIVDDGWDGSYEHSSMNA